MYEELGKEILKTGETIVIKHSAQLALSPAYTFFLREMANLMDEGFAFNLTSWRDKDCGIVWGEIDNNITGIFAYSKEGIWSDIMLILLTAVEKGHRKKGIHTILNRYYEKIAKNLGCNFTCATVSHKNKIRLITAEKDGYKFAYHRLYKKINV